MSLRIKRVYDAPEPSDGVRVLVDRLWPRGLTKQAAAIDHWMKELSPSPELRQWFGHQPERWEGFLERYFRELDAKAEAVDQLRALTAEQTVTLVYSARDAERNQAVALLAWLSRSNGPES